MKRIAAMAVCAVLLLGLASFAQMGSMMIGGADNSGVYLGMRSQLGLSKDQAAKLKAIGTSLMQKNNPLSKQGFSLQKELSTLLQAENQDLAAIESKLKEIQSVDLQVTMNRLAANNDANNVLTGDQKAKIQSLKEQQKAKMQKMMQQRGKPK